MNLRELIDDATHQLNTFKHPSIDEARERLSELLEAADLGSIKHDHLESIEERDNDLLIETSWSTRGCESTSSFRIPLIWLDAEDPIKVAKIWGINKKINEQQLELELHEGQAEMCRKEIIQLKSKLASIN